MDMTYLWIWFCYGIFLLILISLCFLVKKYDNPYKLFIIFGKKGSGKSTLIAKLAYKHIRKKYTVYSSIRLNIPGVRLYDPMNIGEYVFPKKSVVFTDEVGTIWNNRDYKRFDPRTRDYFKFQRHHKNKVYLFSQVFDVDVQIRNLTDYMYMTKCYFNVLSVAHRISRRLVVVEPTGDSEGRIADGYQVDSLFKQIFGAKIAYVTWIPRWTSFFDSFEELPRPEIPYEELKDVPDAYQNRKMKRYSPIFLVCRPLKRALRNLSRRICRKRQRP